MLYQRAVMSSSLRRIFLVTAPSLLNPFGRCPVRKRTPTWLLPDATAGGARAWARRGSIPVAVEDRRCGLTAASVCRAGTAPATPSRRPGQRRHAASTRGRKDVLGPARTGRHGRQG